MYRSRGPTGTVGDGSTSKKAAVGWISVSSVGGTVGGPTTVDDRRWVSEASVGQSPPSAACRGSGGGVCLVGHVVDSAGVLTVASIGPAPSASCGPTSTRCSSAWDRTSTPSPRRISLRGNVNRYACLSLCVCLSSCESWEENGDFLRPFFWHC